MKFIFLSGGLAGFLIAAITSLWVGHAPDRILRDTITRPVGPEFMAPPQTAAESLVA